MKPVMMQRRRGSGEEGGFEEPDEEGPGRLRDGTPYPSLSLPGPSSSGSSNPPSSPDPLLRCIMTGFIDQLCVRRDQGTLECELTEGRRGTLMRESVVQNAALFVAATIREVAGRGSENLTLLGLASVVKREWIEETFPEQITN